MKKYLFLFAALFVMACSDDNESVMPTMSIELSSEGETFGIEGGRTQVTVTSSADWRLTGKKTWCKPSAVAGKSGDQVVFVIDENDTPESSRSITYTFMCGDQIQRYVITQNQKDMIIVDHNEYEIGPDGGRILVDLKSNIDFEITIPEGAKDWLQFIGTRSLSRNVLEFGVAANDTYRQREVTFDLGDVVSPTTKAEGDEEALPSNRLVIRQLKNKGIIAENCVVPTEGGEAVMTIKANIPYTVEFDYMYPQWVQVDGRLDPAPSDEPELVERQVKFKADATSEFDGTRIGSVSIRSTDGSNITVKGLLLQRYGEAIFLDGVTDEKFIKQLKYEKFVYEHEDGRLELLGKGASATSLTSTSYSNIHDITGIEHFTKLQTLDISNNFIKRADLSKNMALTNLKMARTGLEELILGDCPLTAIPGPFSYSNPALTDADRVETTTFTVSSNNLKILKLTGSSSLKTFDITGCPKLEQVVCSSAGFETVDLSHCPNLTFVDFGGNWDLKTVYMTREQESKITTKYIGNAKIEYK